MADLEKNPVSVPCSAYNEMSECWGLIDDLMGGTFAMRKAGTKWLPLESKEKDEDYNVRLNRTTLFAAYKRTIRGFLSKPFSKSVTMQGELPENLQVVFDNPDGQGSDITQFSRELFNALLNRGFTHILTDFPKTPAADGQTPTMAEEKRAGYRPVFVHIKPDQLIGWRSEVVNGKTVLTMIRWRDTKTMPDGEFGEKTVNTIRVYTTTTWQIWEENDKKEYVLKENGTHTFPDGIPLVTCYINKTGFMTAEPPMKELAELNLKHWCGDSDQTNLLRFVRFPLYSFTGITEAEADKEIVIGAGKKFSSTNPDCKVEVIEHTGAACEAGRQDLKDLEDRMTLLGLEPLVSKSGGQTATGQAIDESKSQSDVQSWIRSLENALYKAFEMAAKWVKSELSDDFKVDIFNDFGVSIRASTDIDSLIKLRQAKDIDHETELKEVKRRGLLSENTDIQAVMEAVANEGPALGDMGTENNNIDNSDGGGQ